MIGTMPALFKATMVRAKLKDHFPTNVYIKLFITGEIMLSPSYVQVMKFVCSFCRENILNQITR